MEEINALIYEELRRIAQGLMAHERDDHTLTPTALVHEAWTRLESNDFFQRPVGLQYFYCSAATAMRRILVEHARKFERRRTLLKTYIAIEQQSETAGMGELASIADIDEALNRLAAKYEQEAKLVELRFFAGLTISQAAEALGISLSKANELWRFARAWLMRDLKAAVGDGV